MPNRGTCVGTWREGNEEKDDGRVRVVLFSQQHVGGVRGEVGGWRRRGRQITQQLL